MQIDTTAEFGARVERRLREETLAWLVTTGADGTPEPSPIWFLWDGQTILIYSRPNVPKVRNIRERRSVAFHLESDGDGGDIVVLTGTAEVLSSAPAVAENQAYVAKYADMIKGIGYTPETMGASFSTAIRVTPAKLRGH
jgi:PPOX class probable F420-dependent enzyme